FTIPQSSFRCDNLDSGWDYIGIHEVEITPAKDGNPAVTGNEIVKYQYDQTTNTHIPTVLIQAQPNISYRFIFTKVNPLNSDNLLQFTIKSFDTKSLAVDENSAPKVTITSEVESINSLQIVDLSTNIDPAVAVAFRSQQRNKNVVGHVAMVLDTSGSMSDNLNGNNWGTSRISILKDKAKELVNEFAQEDNIDISLIPFATSANEPHDFLNAKNSTTELNGIISNLNAIGGTNTGDGLRRAYQKLKAHTLDVSTDVVVSNYVIVLVDGVTTFASVKSNSDRSFVTDNQNINEGYLDRTGEFDENGQIAGNGSNLSITGTAYVNKIGNMLNTNSFAKTYVIGFSTKNSELASVNDIATACGAPSERVFTASSADSLQTVFKAIQDDIVNDLWYLQGPNL
ncbi:MAG: VWA domain-containing protein, partial [Clostridiaceae bacterium]